jgi:hypothetical protein
MHRHRADRGHHESVHVFAVAERLDVAERPLRLGERRGQHNRAPMRSEMRPGTRQHPLPIAEIGDGKVSWARPSPCGRAIRACVETSVGPILELIAGRRHPRHR